MVMEVGLLTITGGEGEDWIDGNSGDDSLTGTGKDDTIYGSEGNDTLRGTRSLEQVRRRGRWASLKSVERYSKTAHIVADLAHLDPEVRRLGDEFLASPDAFTAAQPATVRFC